MDYKEDLSIRIAEQFDYLNQNPTIISDTFYQLKNENYTVNTQIEQITFKQIEQNITALIEKVDLNSNEQEQNLLQAVLNEYERRFSNRPTLPYKISHFRNFTNQDNRITIKTIGIPYTGIETFTFLLMLERLIQIRPSYIEAFGDRIEFIKEEAIKYKFIYDDDVWFSYAEVEDESTIVYHFLVLTFEVREQLQPYMEAYEQQQNSFSQQDQTQEEAAPWYGTKRYDLVDHVLTLQAEKDKLAQRSAVQEAALRSQEPYMTQTMKDIERNYNGPPKYLNQRDSPLEIPIEIIKNFFQAVDQDMDDRISIEELYQYSQKKFMPFSEDVIVDMFKEASSGRGIVHEKQREAPLTLDEVCASVRGRHRWNPQQKQWEVYYRPFRDHWIIFLQTVNERLFAMPIPKVVPTKILAQFEEEELAREQAKLLGSTIIRKEGIDKKYLSIKDQKIPQYQKDLGKTEAGIVPEGTVKYFEKKQKRVDLNPYEHQINARISGSESDSNGFPRVTFEAKEFFNQANLLSQVIPHWQSEKQNPIYQYVPTTERPFTNDSDALFNQQLQQKQMQQSLREQRLSQLQGKDRSLQLAGTMALYNSKTSPWDVMKERQGFVTKFKVPTILDQKMENGKRSGNQFDEVGQLKPISNPYNPPSDHKFRDLEIPRGQNDFVLRYKAAQAYNPYGVSEHDLRPKEVLERQRRQEDKERERKRLEYESILKGKPLEKKKDWVYYHTLPHKITPIAQNFKDKHTTFPKEKNPFLDKEEFTPAYTQLARQMKDDVVFGKPNFNLYFKSLNPKDINEEFGGVKVKPYKCIY